MESIVKDPEGERDELRAIYGRRGLKARDSLVSGLAGCLLVSFYRSPCLRVVWDSLRSLYFYRRNEDRNPGDFPGPINRFFPGLKIREPADTEILPWVLN
jgi:hypothetical protein